MKRGVWARDGEGITRLSPRGDWGVCLPAWLQHELTWSAAALAPPAPAQVQSSKDPEGLRVFYYLVQVLAGAGVAMGQGMDACFFSRRVVCRRGEPLY